MRNRRVHYLSTRNSNYVHILCMAQASHTAAQFVLLVLIWRRRLSAGSQTWQQQGTSNRASLMYRRGQEYIVCSACGESAPKQARPPAASKERAKPKAPGRRNWPRPSKITPCMRHLVCTHSSVAQQPPDASAPHPIAWQSRTHHPLPGRAHPKVLSAAMNPISTPAPANA